MLSFVCLHYEKRQWLKIESMKDAVDSRVWATFVEFDDTKNEEKFTFGQKWEKKVSEKPKIIRFAYEIYKKLVYEKEQN